MPLQTSIPGLDPVPDSNSNIRLEKRHVKSATFKAGLVAPVHRWFRLTPSFGPELVGEMLEALECRKNDLVLDPFSGAGTTMIECQLRGIKSIGCEINPLLHFVSNTSLRWGLNANLLCSILEQIGERYHKQLPGLTAETLVESGFPFPTIHNPYRWWRPDVLVGLCSLLKAISIESPNREMREFFELGLAGVLVPDLTNVTTGRLQLHFINREQDTIDVWSAFHAHCKKMISDIELVQSRNLQQTSNVFHLNSASKAIGNVRERVDCVITSPPYPNRYSYVWNTRPHLYLFEFFKTAREASALDIGTIGGTWGTATSSLSKGTLAASCTAVANVVGALVDDIRLDDNLMANYVMKYFNDIAEHFTHLQQIASSNARVAYVVGCSRIKGRYVETDVLLGRLIEQLDFGYEVREVHRFRKRHSGVDLHEGIVYAFKS